MLIPFCVPVNSKNFSCSKKKLEKTTNSVSTLQKLNLIQIKKTAMLSYPSFQYILLLARLESAA